MPDLGSPATNGPHRNCKDYRQRADERQRPPRQQQLSPKKYELGVLAVDRKGSRPHVAGHSILLRDQRAGHPIVGNGAASIRAGNDPNVRRLELDDEAERHRLQNLLLPESQFPIFRGREHRAIGTRGNQPSLGQSIT